MTISVFDLFRIGIGPSSSHTVGPMRAARLFAQHLIDTGAANRTNGIRVVLYGSLGATGAGHGTIPAVVLGLCGAQPESIDPDGIAPTMAAIAATGELLSLIHI